MARISKEYEKSLDTLERTIAFLCVLLYAGELLIVWLELNHEVIIPMASLGILGTLCSWVVSIGTRRWLFPLLNLTTFSLLQTMAYALSTLVGGDTLPEDEFVAAHGITKSQAQAIGIFEALLLVGLGSALGTFVGQLIRKRHVRDLEKQMLVL